NQERTDVTRTYNNNQNRVNGQLGTWFVDGDIIWIEYYQPANTQNVARLQINSVIHGYRMGRVNALLEGNRGLNDSGECNYDVNCPVGSDFDTKKDLVKKAVSLLNLGNGYLCSAALINNTRNDKTPYLLTTNHCLQNSNPSLWSIRFNWVSPTPVCGTGDESGDLQTNFTISGAELRANNAKSDFALVELFDKIPESWDVAFAGWDNSDNDPLFEVGIHHPNGDIMKICRDDSGAEKIDANGTQVWLIGGGNHGSGNGWEIGTTESGSSGSPLFDENGRIIGQLYAGQSACNGLENNGDYDIYGRFGISWNYGTTQQTRLKEWLDPTNSGHTTVETLQNLLNIP
ncbi:MAG TPA: secretion system protein Por, partial [Aequorivita sp.]|nr:secretion system protein Por [Aequorivita sp.]